MTYTGTFSYQVQSLFLVPGLNEFDRFNDATRLAFMDLVLGSSHRWPDGWDNVTCRKTGGVSSYVPLKSPLWFALSHLKWLGFPSANGITWNSPSERWHVPAKALGARTWQFKHLRPLPAPVAHILDTNPALAAVMVGLGMPQFDLETKSGSTRLLEALAHSAECDEIREPNVFLGQVRAAWGVFVPTAGQRFPRKMLVSRTGMHLTAVTPSLSEPVFLPDSTRSFVSSLEQFDSPVLAIDPTDAKRLAALFNAAFGAAVIRTSTLRLVPVVDGNAWEDGDGQRLYDTELEWLIPVVLTLAAYYGLNPRGTGTARFGGQVQVFREVKVVWCATLAAGLYSGEKILAQPDTRALWVPNAKTLLVTHDCRDDPSLLSEALANILERDDLDVPIKLVLRETGLQPQPQDIVRALAHLRLTESQWIDAREHWRGNLRHIIQLLMPLLAILKPTFNLGKLAAVETEEQLSQYLMSMRDTRIDTDTILSMARDIADPYEFGTRCFQKFGPHMQLDQWNAVLSRLRERPLQNRSATTEFDAHASQAKQPLRCLLAYVILQKRPEQTFRHLLAELESISCPGQFATSLWEVQFADVLSAFSPMFERLSASPEAIAILQHCDSTEEFIGRLSETGVDPFGDPVQTARDNRERLRVAVVKLQQIGLAWAVSVQGTSAALWELRVESCMAALDGDLATEGYLWSWHEDEIFSRLRSLPRDIESAAFWEAVDQSASFWDLESRLNLTAEALAGATGKLSALKEEARRQKKMVEICGHEFDGSEDNLAGLWSHICTGMPADAVGTLPPVDLSKTLELSAPAKSRSSGRPSSSTDPQVVAPRISKGRENLVGLAGEIHAFRRLQEQYGLAVVSATAWLSSNGLLVYPDNLPIANDGAGCDFRFTIEGRTFHVEVKSSSGSDEIFTLGSSEIRLAMDLAKSKKRRQKDVFVLLRVLNALSNEPTFQVLPNPYDERYQSLYDIVEAGARVRYRALQ